MMTPGELWRRAVYLLRRDRRTADLEEEMRLHWELRARSLEQRGVPNDEAAIRARRAFGDSVRHAERSRDEWGAAGLEAIAHDVRAAGRGLRRTPWLSAVIIVTLALVIGASTAIFGLLHSLFLQRLPIPAAEQLTAVQPMNDGRLREIVHTQLETLRSAPGVPRLEGYLFDAVRMVTEAGREDVWVDYVTGGYFELLGVQPVLGRTLTEADATSGVPVAVISTDVWQEHFGGRDDVLGRTVTLDGSAATVVGVLPPEYSGVHFARPFSIAMHMSFHPRLRPTYVISLITRLPQDAAARARAAAALDAAYLTCCVASSMMPGGSEAVAAEAPRMARPDDAPTGHSHYRSADRRPHVELTDASRGLTWSVDHRGTYGRVLAAAFGGVAILLLIACSNIGTLLLARATTRRREFAIRMSIGAGRTRVLRQLFAESLALAAVGGAAGVWLAGIATRALVVAAPPSASPIRELVVWEAHTGILAFTAGVVIFCTLLFGLWPARLAWRTDVLSALKHDGNVGSRPGRADSGLVVAQLALATVLISAASLLTSTLRNINRYTVGSESIVVARWSADHTRYAALPAEVLAREALEAASGTPGVSAAALTNDLPMYPDGLGGTGIGIPGAPSGGSLAPVRVNSVSPHYFRAAGITLLRGREFTAADDARGARVAILSEALAREHWGSEDPLGLSFTASDSTVITIVGIAADARYDDPRAAVNPTMYVPTAQSGHSMLFAHGVIVRADRDARAVAADLRERIGSLDPEMHVMLALPMTQMLDDMLVRERLAAALAVLFGAVALLLVGTGVYGMLAHRTASRTHEIGVRMALGASAANALWMVLHQALRLASIGLAAGVPLAFAFAWLVRAQFFGVAPGDPRILAGSAAILLAVVVLGSLLPGLRAARVQPIIALRAD